MWLYNITVHYYITLLYVVLCCIKYYVYIYLNYIYINYIYINYIYINYIYIYIFWPGQFAQTGWLILVQEYIKIMILPHLQLGTPGRCEDVPRQVVDATRGFQTSQESPRWFWRW